MKVLITGGTGSLGRELVRKFAETKECDTVFTYHNNSRRAEEMAKQYCCKAIKVDEIGDDYDIVINNAGIVNSLVPCEEVELKAWEETLYVNLTLPFIVIKKVLPHMKQIGWGRIINISSVYGVKAEEDITPYVASKHGLIGLTKVVAKEYARYGITCNAICPGTITSELCDRLASCYTKNDAEQREYFDELNRAIPAKRLANVNDVAEFVQFIASKEAAYINGATLMIDGGYTA